MAKSNLDFKSFKNQQNDFSNTKFTRLYDEEFVKKFVKDFKKRIADPIRKKFNEIGGDLSEELYIKSSKKLFNKILEENRPHHAYVLKNLKGEKSKLRELFENVLTDYSDTSYSANDSDIQKEESNSEQKINDSKKEDVSSFTVNPFAHEFYSQSNDETNNQDLNFSKFNMSKLTERSCEHFYKYIAPKVQNDDTILEQDLKLSLMIALNSYSRLKDICESPEKITLEEARKNDTSLRTKEGEENKRKSTYIYSELVLNLIKKLDENKNPKLYREISTPEALVNYFKNSEHREEYKVDDNLLGFIKFLIIINKKFFKSTLLFPAIVNDFSYRAIEEYVIYKLELLYKISQQVYEKSLSDFKKISENPELVTKLINGVYVLVFFYSYTYYLNFFTTASDGNKNDPLNCYNFNKVIFYARLLIARFHKYFALREIFEEDLLNKVMEKFGFEVTSYIKTTSNDETNEYTENDNQTKEQKEDWVLDHTKNVLRKLSSYLGRKSTDIISDFNLNWFYSFDETLTQKYSQFYKSSEITKNFLNSRVKSEDYDEEIKFKELGINLNRNKTGTNIPYEFKNEFFTSLIDRLQLSYIFRLFFEHESKVFGEERTFLDKEAIINCRFSKNLELFKKISEPIDLVFEKNQDIEKVKLFLTQDLRLRFLESYGIIFNHMGVSFKDNFILIESKGIVHLIEFTARLLNSSDRTYEIQEYYKLKEEDLNTIFNGNSLSIFNKMVRFFGINDEIRKKLQAKNLYINSSLKSNDDVDIKDQN